MKRIMLATFLLVWPVQALAQATESSTLSDPLSPRPRVATILAGIGNATGGFGFQADYYYDHDRLSLFTGVGYLPSSETGVPSSVALATGARIFTRGTKHRALLELSMSQLAREWSTRNGKVISSHNLYGPGIQVGYQFTGQEGQTFIAAIGLGYILNVSPRNDMTPLAPTPERDRKNTQLPVTA